MNFLELTEDLIGLILSPHYVDSVDRMMLSWVCKDLRGRLIGCLDDDWLCDVATKGYLEILKLIDETGYPILTCTIYHSISAGHLAISKWLYKKGCTAIYFGPRKAVAGGHLDVVKWVHKKGHNYTNQDCVIAVREGHYHVLKFLIETGCRLNTEVYVEAICQNRLDMMQSLLTNIHRHISHDTSCAHAITCGHFEMLKLLHSHGCKLGRESMIIAACAGRLDILEWIYEVGCWQSHDAHQEALRGATSNGHTDVVSWLETIPIPRN